MTFKPANDEPPQRGNSKRSSGTTKRAARPSTRSLRKEIDAFVVFLNGVVGVVAPNDALDSIEVAALVHAIDEEARTNAKFRRGLESLLNITSGGSLWMVVAIIGARRVARHGMVGQFGPIVDDGGAFILSTINAEPSEAAETMGSIINMFKYGNDTHESVNDASPTDSATDRSTAT